MPEETEEYLPPYYIYELGRWIRQIEDSIEMTDSTTLEYGKLNSVKGPLKEIRSIKNPKISDITEEAEEHFQKLAKEDECSTFDISKQKKLEKDATRWNEKIKETLKRTNVVLANPKNIDISSLRKGVGGFLSEEEIEFLTKSEISVLQEACKVALVGCPTSTVMCSLRVVESLLRRWYEVFTGEEVGRKAWGEILGEIGDKFEKEKSEIGFLRFLKDKRNKVMHPQKVPKQGEAETTLQMTMNTVVPILKKEIEKQK